MNVKTASEHARLKYYGLLAFGCFSNRSCSIMSIVLIDIRLVCEGMKDIADLSSTSALSEELSAL